ncbi:MAG TPA: GNAT family N-acetyltransferase [Chloroflexaceae bacterium]|nr:GNAT family N-acetyltransferase [Chloroflexaceae bacterium]
MEYRALAEADIERCVALESYAFRSNSDRSDLARGKIARFRGLFAGGELLAQLELIPLRLRAGLGEVAAGGVGSVAGAPETRRRGHVAALMRHLADELRAAGVPLCVLYPFKRSFYGRYGWATFYERRLYSGPPERFAHFRPGPGRFTPAGPEQIDELDQIYAGALRGRFGTIVRDREWWERRVLRGWDGRPHHAFIWRDEAGQGRSYLIFSLEGQGGDAAMRCREMVALDPLARAQLFAFVAGHQDQMATVRFYAPADAPVNLLFPDPLECAVEPRFMLRLLDVPAALAAYTFPRDVAGRLTLAVSDDWITANNGSFALELEGGRCRVSRLPDGAQANLSCDVRVLAQLYSRYLRPRTAAAFGLLEAPDRAALALADAAFAGLAPFSADFF